MIAVARHAVVHAHARQMSRRCRSASAGRRVRARESPPRP